VTADTGRFEWKGGGDNWFEIARGLFAQLRNTGLAIGKINDYTSSALSTRAQD